MAETTVLFIYVIDVVCHVRIAEKRLQSVCEEAMTCIG